MNTAVEVNERTINISVQQNLLAQAFAMVYPAISTEGIRWIINHVKVIVRKGSITLIATDARVLHQAIIDAHVDEIEEESVFYVDRKTAKLLSELPNHGHTVGMSIIDRVVSAQLAINVKSANGKNKPAFEKSLTWEGRFPRCEQIISETAKDSTESFVVSRLKWLEATGVNQSFHISKDGSITFEKRRSIPIAAVSKSFSGFADPDLLDNFIGNLPESCNDISVRNCDKNKRFKMTADARNVQFTGIVCHLGIDD